MCSQNKKKELEEKNQKKCCICVSCICVTLERDLDRVTRFIAIKKKIGDWEKIFFPSLQLLFLFMAMNLVTLSRSLSSVTEGGHLRMVG